MSRAFALVAALLALLAASPANASFYYTREGQIAQLSPEIAYRIEERSAPPTFEAISREEKGWIAQKDKPFTGMREPALLWIRFDIPPGITAKRVLMNVPLWDREEFFVVRDGKLIDRQKAGVLVPMAERPVRVTMTPTLAAGFVQLDLVPGARTTIYGRLESLGETTRAEVLLARFWDPERVAEAERRDRIVQGLYFGVMLFLIVYNLALFFVVREARFIYYVLFESAYTLVWAAMAGLSAEYLSSGQLQYEPRYTWFAVLVGGFGAWQFLRHYLETFRNFPRLDVALKVIAYVQLFLAPFPLLLPPGSFERMAFATGPVGVVVLITVTVLAVKHRLPSATSLLAAMACVGVGFSIFSGVAGGWLPQNVWTVQAGQIGSVLGGVILSIGLGVRMQEERTRLARLKRFLSPKVSELIATGQLDDPLATRRREVTIVFVDLRGFTAFSETAEPEDVLGVLREYHAEVGRLVDKHQGTIEHFAGDGVMIIFNDPVPLPDAALAAVSFGVQLRDNVVRLAQSWQKLGHNVGAGIGIAQGYATIGTIGFEGRQDYGVIGAVCNLSARLCAQAAAGQVLVSQRVHARVEDRVVAELVGELTLKGIQAPVPAYNVLGMKAAQTALAGGAAGVEAGS